MKRMLNTGLVACLLVLAACNQKPRQADEVRIQSMDSTEKVVKTHTEELEEQTKKVEASLEKLDEEFPRENTQ